jgi:ABC-2 type transport system permease protein
VLATSLNYGLTLMINMGIVLAFFMIDGVGLNRYAFLFLVYIAELYMIVLGISFLLSVAYLRFRDIVEIWAILITAGFYATPIIYPIEQVPPAYRNLLYLNPITFIVEYSKRVMVEGRILDAPYSAKTFMIGNAIILTESLLLLIVGFMIFRKLAPRAAEYL